MHYAIKPKPIALIDLTTGKPLMENGVAIVRSFEEQIKITILNDPRAANGPVELAELMDAIASLDASGEVWPVEGAMYRRIREIAEKPQIRMSPLVECQCLPFSRAILGATTEPPKPVAPPPPPPEAPAVALALPEAANG